MRRVHAITGIKGVIAAVFAAVALSACDQGPTKTEAPKITSDEARKIREDKFNATQAELDKAKAEANAVQDKLGEVLNGKAQGDLDALALQFKELNEKVSRLTLQLNNLSVPRTFVQKENLSDKK
jgi:polyhydroxyalkanoate synthesis regulator phasin